MRINPSGVVLCTLIIALSAVIGVSAGAPWTGLAVGLGVVLALQLAAACRR